MPIFTSIPFAAGLILSNLLAAAAQTSNVTCLSKFSWMTNSRHQTPCLVAAYLQGACFSDGEFSIDTLPPDTHYSGPYASDADKCQCSTVTYSMVSACGLCQNETIIPWSTWAGNCSADLISESKYPRDVPSGTAIPSWAYLSVKTKDTFDSVAAQAEANSGIPESSALSAVSTSTSTSGSTQSSSTTVISKSNTTNVGAIAGGVVGGVIVLGLIAALIVFIILRDKRKSRMAPSALFSLGSNNGQLSNNMSGIPPSDSSTGLAETAAMAEKKFYEDTVNFHSPNAHTMYSTSHLQHPGVPEV